MSFNQAEEVDVNVTLDQLNNEVVATKYGAIILLGVFIPIGVIGNGHVLHIYIFKKKNNNTRVFVCCLAVIDFVASFIFLPWFIYHHSMPLKSFSDAACKILFNISYFLAAGEALMLLVLAIERYKKVCEPFKPQFTLKQAKVISALVFIITFVLSTPVLVLFGNTVVPTIHPNITGNECEIYKELRGTFWETLYHGIILVILLCLSIALLVIYSLIGVKILRHQARMKMTNSDEFHKVGLCTETGQTQNKENAPTVIELVKREPASITDGAMADEIQGDEDIITDQTQSPELSTTLNRNYKTDTHAGLQSFSKDSANSSSGVARCTDRHIRALATGEIETSKQIKRTVYMFFVISLFYILSYIPYPIIRMYETFTIDWYNKLSHSEHVALSMARCTPYLSNVVNSFIYMIFDTHYRNELKSVYGRLFFWKGYVATDSSSSV